MIVKNTKNKDTNSSDFNVFQYMLEGVLEDVNTLKVCRVHSVNADGTLNVTNMVYQVDAFGKPIEPVVWKNFPILKRQGGNGGIVITYQPGDIVLVGFCDRDIQAVKRSKSASAPGTRTLFALSAGIVLGAVLTQDPSVNLTVTDKLYANGDMEVSQNLTVAGEIKANGGIDATAYKAQGTPGVTGTFTDTGTGASGRTLTIKNGIITGIN